MFSLLNANFVSPLAGGWGITNATTDGNEAKWQASTRHALAARSSPARPAHTARPAVLTLRVAQAHESRTFETTEYAHCKPRAPCSCGLLRRARASLHRI